MALIKCTECGCELSEYADKCPKCGCPTNIILDNIKNKEGNAIQQLDNSVKIPESIKAQPVLAGTEKNRRIQIVYLYWLDINGYLLYVVLFSVLF